MATVDNERPPYYAFERIAVEDRDASIKAGHYVAKDVDYVRITRPGSRDNVVEEPHVWLEKLRRRAADGQIPLVWVQHFEQAYEEWKRGEDLPLSGTPIKGWQVLSPAQQATLLHLGIRTVEDLANLGEAELQNIGIGAHGLKEKARAWLAAAENQGKIAEQVSSMTVLIEEMKATIAALQEENKKLREAAKVKAKELL